jgi:hypothetical protein
MAPPPVRHEAEEDSLDAAIVSLRRAVERDARRHNAPRREDAARPVAGSPHEIELPAWAVRERAARRPHLQPILPFPVVRRIRRFLRRCRFEILFYGLCIGVTVAVALMVVAASLGRP